MATASGGTTASITADSSGFLTTRIVTPPISVTPLRSPIDRSELTVSCSRETSSPNRDSNAPVRFSWKNDCDSVTIRRYTSTRRSSTARSPTHVIR